MIYCSVCVCVCVYARVRADIYVCLCKYVCVCVFVYLVCLHIRFANKKRIKYFSSTFLPSPSIFYRTSTYNTRLSPSMVLDAAMFIILILRASKYKNCVNHLSSASRSFHIHYDQLLTLPKWRPSGRERVPGEVSDRFRGCFLLYYLSYLEPSLTSYDLPPLAYSRY